MFIALIPALNNGSFMPYGKYSVMKKICCVTLKLLMVIQVYSQLPEESPRYVTLNNTVQQLKKSDDITNVIYAFLDFYLANSNEEELFIFEKCENFLWRPPATPGEQLAYVILQCNKGYYVGLYAEINAAVDAYEKAWKMYNDHHLSGFDIIEYCLKPLGNNYSMLGDYNSAANIIRDYLFLAEQQHNTNHIVSALINLAVVYHNTGRQAEAIQLLNKTLTIRQMENAKKGIVYSNMARNYFDLQDRNNAEQWASKAIIYFKKYPTRDTPLHVVNTYTILSQVNLQNNALDKALQFTYSAQQIAAENPRLFKNRDLAKILNAEAGILKEQGKYDETLATYQETLKLLLPAFKPRSKTEMPQPILFYSENTIKETFDELADLFIKLNDYPKALQCFESSFRVEDLLRKTYNYQEAQLQQQRENRSRTEQALELLHSLYEKTGALRYAQHAFQLAERTKALVLKETIEESYKRRFIKNDSLLKMEHDLVSKKAKFENDMILEQMKDKQASLPYINQLMSKQTALSIEIKQLRKVISEKYPALDTSTMSFNLDELQKKIGAENATLIEYFSGKTSLYRFQIEATQIQFHKLPNSQQVYDTIRKFIPLFSEASAINNNVSTYSSLAFTLYTMLGIPQPSVSKTLLIIPDGLISYIPFEALLTEKCNHVNFASFPYLLKKFIIAYHASASIYLNDGNGILPDNGEKILAMFPIFENSGRELKHSRDEASQIKMVMKGDFLVGDQATRRNFQNKLNQFDLIHLSTHATAGSADGPPSIMFIDSTLYLPEIYGMQLHTHLMVLSACETGVGKIVKGEGALSLARGFQYAGVRNIIFSLWNVNDYAAATLMSSFYNYYAKGETKAVALHQAKLDYITDENISNSRKSPYYWAAFIYYGDINTRPGNKMFLCWMVTCVLIFALIAAVIKLRRSFILNR
jgi:CHAT domain-containing protein